MKFFARINFRELEKISKLNTRKPTISSNIEWNRAILSNKGAKFNPHETSKLLISQTIIPRKQINKSINNITV